MAAVFFILSALLAGAFAGGLINDYGSGAAPYGNRGYRGPFNGFSGYGAGPVNAGVVGVARAQPVAPVVAPAAGLVALPAGYYNNGGYRANPYGSGYAGAVSRPYQGNLYGNNYAVPYGNAGTGGYGYGGYRAVAAPVRAAVGVAVHPDGLSNKKAAKDAIFNDGFGSHFFGKGKF